jgi:hypothetical protein
VFPVRYELNLYIKSRRNSVFKELINGEFSTVIVLRSQTTNNELGHYVKVTHSDIRYSCNTFSS